MKAVTCTHYGPPEVLTIIDTDKPVPKDNEVLIKIHASIISPVDCAFRTGSPFISRFFTGLTKPKFIPGDILAGEITATGKQVTLFKTGDRVYGSSMTDFGTNAEYKCLPENGALAIMPDNMNYGEAAAICDGGITALPFLRDNGKIKSGRTVLINGASGSVGTFAIQLAKYFGAKVTGVCSTANIAMVKSLGADKVIDYTKEDFTQNGQTYDIIFDTVAKRSFAACKGSLTPNGIYLTTYPSLLIIFQSIWTSLYGNKKAVFAATGLRRPAEKVKDLVFFKKLAETGKIKSVIDKKYPLTKIVDAHTYVSKGHKKGNVILDIANSQ